jgi:hypothetical protein
MKRLLFLAFIPSLAFASADNPTRAELLQTVKHIAALAKETQAELDAEKAAHAQTEAALSGALKANQDTQSQFASYQAAAETQIKKGNDAVTKLAALVRKHHLDLIILCGLWVGFVALLYLKAGTMLGPVGVYVAGGLGVAGVAFIIWRL